MKKTPMETLEIRALEQRNRLHQSASQLRSEIAVVRKRLGIARNTRNHFPAVSIVSSLLALLVGYGVAGAFTRH